MRNTFPEFDCQQMCKCLERLGFERCPPGKHQYRYKHPTRKTHALRPFIVIPTDLRKDRNLRKAILKSLIMDWGFTEDEILAAL